MVDCAPTAETLRLLSLPEVMNWYIERIFPVERRVVKTIRPLLSRLTQHADRRRPDLRGGRAPAPQPRRRAPAAHQRADVDGPPGGEPREDGDRRGAADLHLPVAVRLPGGRGRREPDHPRRGRDPYFGKWKDIQAEHLGDDQGVVRAGARSSPRGCSTARWSASSCWPRWARRCTATSTRSAILHRDEPIRGAQARRRHTCCRSGLPFVERADLDVFRQGRRAVRPRRAVQAQPGLPQTLQRLEVQDASFVDDRLEVRFRRAKRRSGGDGGGGDAKTRRDRMAEVIVEEGGGGVTGRGTGRRRAAPASFSFCPICMALTAVGDARPGHHRASPGGEP